MSAIASDTIRVVLLAESRLVREALTEVLDRESDIHVVVSACFGTEELRCIEMASPDVALIDSDSLASGDLAMIEEIHKEVPDARVIMIGMEADREMFLRSARAGITGYLLKDASARDVIAVVRSAMRGEASCPPKLCQLLFECVARHCARIPGLSAKLEFGLTRREQQLLQMIGCGLTNKEIAGELKLSDQTVKHHVHQILHKVGANDRLTAVEVCRVRGMCA